MQAFQCQRCGASIRTIHFSKGQQVVSIFAVRILQLHSKRNSTIHLNVPCC